MSGSKESAGEKRVREVDEDLDPEEESTSVEADGDLAQFAQVLLLLGECIGRSNNNPTERRNLNQAINIAYDGLDCYAHGDRRGYMSALAYVREHCKRCENVVPQPPTTACLIDWGLYELASQKVTQGELALGLAELMDEVAGNEGLLQMLEKLNPITAGLAGSAKKARK